MPKKTSRLVRGIWSIALAALAAACADTARQDAPVSPPEPPPQTAVQPAVPQETPTTLVAVTPERKPVSAPQQLRMSPVHRSEIDEKLRKQTQRR